MADLKKLAEEIVGLTLLEAQELKTILKDEYGIEPAAGGAVVTAGYEFDVPVRFDSDTIDVNLAAFDRFGEPGRFDGQITALFIIVLAAAEAALAVGICINVYKNLSTVDVDTADALQG